MDGNKSSQKYGQNHWVNSLSRDNSFLKAYKEHDPDAMEFFIKKRLNGNYCEWLTKNVEKRLDDSNYSMKFAAVIIEKGSAEQIEWMMETLKPWFKYGNSAQVSHIAQIAAYDGNTEALKVIYEKNQTAVCDRFVMDAAVWSGNIETVTWLHKNCGTLTDDHIEECASRGTIEMLIHLLMLRGNERDKWAAKLVRRFHFRDRPHP